MHNFLFCQANPSYTQNLHDREVLQVLRLWSLVKAHSPVHFLLLFCLNYINKASSTSLWSGFLSRLIFYPFFFKSTNNFVSVLPNCLHCWINQIKFTTHASFLFTILDFLCHFCSYSQRRRRVVIFYAKGLLLLEEDV